MSFKEIDGSTGRPIDTELSAAAALADNTTNPTTSLIGACVLVFDGSTWDRLRGDSVDGVYVQGAVDHSGVDTGGPVKVGGRAASSQIAAITAADRSDMIMNLYGEQVIAGYDWSTGTNAVTEADPISSHHVEETLIDASNITTNTTTYAYIDMDGYRYITFQNETSGTTPTDILTLTLEATCQDDGTAPASCTYQDVTTALTGAASYVDTDCMWIIDTAGMFKYLRIKYVTSNGAGNDADLTTYIKKGY